MHQKNLAWPRLHAGEPLLDLLRIGMRRGAGELHDLGADGKLTPQQLDGLLPRGDARTARLYELQISIAWYDADRERSLSLATLRPERRMQAGQGTP